MKKKVFWIALCFLILTTTAFAELTQSDFEKIQSIVEKSVEASEKRIMQYIDIRIDALEKRMDTFEKNLKEYVDIKIESVDKAVGRNFYLLMGIIALIVVAVGIPQILIAIQSKKYDKLVDDVEMLKQHRIVKP